MIIFKQELIVSHDDPKADYYKSVLSKAKEDGWQMDEDTVVARYTKTIYFTEGKQEVAK